MRIAHIFAPGDYGGLETVVESLAIGQVREGYRVSVLSVVPPGANPPFHARLRDGGVEVVPLLNPGRRYLAERRGVRDALRRLRPDVVHTHGFKVNIIDGTAASGAGFPTVGTVHGLDPSDRRDRIYHALERIAFRRRFDAVIAVSAILEEMLGSGGVPRNRIHMIQNAILAPEPMNADEARTILSVPERALSIGWIGRMVKVKGLDHLLEAARELADTKVSGRSLRWTLVGDGPEREALQSWVAEEGLGDVVRFTGPIREAGRLMRGFDLFALTSHAEGTPMVLLEAISAGVPILSTAVGGIPALVTPAEAILVDPGSGAKIAEGVRCALSDPKASAERVERASVRIAESFAPGRWVERHSEVYESAIRRRGERTR